MLRCEVKHSTAISSSCSEGRASCHASTGAPDLPSAPTATGQPGQCQTTGGSQCCSQLLAHPRRWGIPCLNCSGHSRAPSHTTTASGIVQLPLSVVRMPLRIPGCQTTQGIRLEPRAAVPGPGCAPKSRVSFALPYCSQVPATPGCSQPSPAGTRSTAFAWLQFTAIHTDRTCI